MNRMTCRGRIAGIVAVLVVSILIAGCGTGEEKGLGSAIPPDAARVKLADIMANPIQFNDKSVVIQGTISGQCPSLCEFFFKEGVHTATIFPQGYKLPKLQTGKKVTAYVRITSGSANVVFSALGLRFDKGAS